MRHHSSDIIEADPAANRRRALADVKRRLLAIETSLVPAACDERALRAAASELETVIHRVRWLADVSEIELEAKDLRPCRDATLKSTIGL